MVDEKFSRYRDLPSPDLWPEIERRLRSGDSSPHPSRHRLLGTVVALTTSALVVAGVAAVLVVRSSHDRPQVTEAASSPATSSEPQSNAPTQTQTSSPSPATTPPSPSGPGIIGTVELPGTYVAGITTGFGALWALGSEGLSRIDPTTREISWTKKISTGGPYEALTAGQGGVWLLAGEQVARVEPTTGSVVARIRVGDSVGLLAAGSGGVWVGDFVRGTVSMVDPDTNTLGEPITIPCHTQAVCFPVSLASGEGSLWVSSLEDTVYRIDPATGDIAATIPGVGGHPGAALAIGFGSVWAAGAGTVRIDPETASVEAEWTDLDFAPGNAEIETGEGYVWLLGIQGGLLFRVDPATNEQVGDPLNPFSRSVGSYLAVGEGAVWETGPPFAPVVVAEIDPRAGISS
ncbi:MAG TPA: hypothetical protein VGB19_05545 [Actinomycetota bacterium]